MGVWEHQLEMWDREWRGPSFNAEGLLAELRGRSAAEAVSDRNHEDYTVYGVALHVHQYKELMLSELEKRPAEWPVGDDPFPAVPEAGLTEAAWAELIHRMDETHTALLDRARSLDESFLETEFTPWKIRWWEVFGWAAGHDTYHTAHIRNMRR